MKKFTLTVLILLTALAFSGCQLVQNEPDGPLTRVVTQATITQDGVTRSYSSSDSVEAILTYLRHLNPRGTPEDMTSDPVSVYDITLTYSDGYIQSFRQLDNRFFLDHDGQWKNIDESKALDLSKLFHLLEPDEAPVL